MVGDSQVRTNKHDSLSMPGDILLTISIGRSPLGRFITQGGEGRGNTSKKRKATKSRGRGREEGASRALMREVGGTRPAAADALRAPAKPQSQGEVPNTAHVDRHQIPVERFEGLSTCPQVFGASS